MRTSSAGTDPYIVTQVGLDHGNTSLELPLATFGDVTSRLRTWLRASKPLLMVPQV